MSDSSKKAPGEKKHEFHDKRKYPRIEQDGEVTLILPDGRKLTVRMFDISPDGMQVRFDRETAVVVKPVVENIFKKMSADLQIIFTLPVSGDVKHDANCRPIYIHRIDNGIYAMGMQFRSLGNEGRKALKKFIETSMEPL